jgi:hypothetical protein
MKIFVNASGVPVKTKKPMLDGRIVGGTETDITSHPYQVWSLCYCSVLRYFEVFEQKRLYVFVMTKYWSSKYIKQKNLKNKGVAVCNSGGIFD